jgi:hypothetical protein
MAIPIGDAVIVDIGGREATLVDDLVDRGYRHVSVLDVSATALEVSKGRLGKHAGAVDWLRGDVTTFSFRHHHYDVWHDRTVFHFLIRPEDRAAYVRQVGHAVNPAGTSTLPPSVRKDLRNAAV